jgi:hypothetical protein
VLPRNSGRRRNFSAHPIHQSGPSGGCPARQLPTRSAWAIRWTRAARSRLRAARRS